MVPYCARFSRDQRRGLDHLHLALLAMQNGQRDHAKIVSRSRSDPGGAASSAGASGWSEADLVSEAGSNAPSAATTGAPGMASKRSRRRSNKVAYGQRPHGADVDAESLVSEEALDHETYEAQGFEFCMGTYWVPPQRLGWCRCCAALDDWKVMKAEYDLRWLLF